MQTVVLKHQRGGSKLSAAGSVPQGLGSSDRHCGSLPASTAQTMQPGKDKLRAHQEGSKECSKQARERVGDPIVISQNRRISL